MVVAIPILYSYLQYKHRVVMLWWLPFQFFTLIYSISTESLCYGGCHSNSLLLFTVSAQSRYVMVVAIPILYSYLQYQHRVVMLWWLPFQFFTLIYSISTESLCYGGCHSNSLLLFTVSAQSRYVMVVAIPILYSYLQYKHRVVMLWWLPFQFFTLIYSISTESLCYGGCHSNSLLLFTV